MKCVERTLEPVGHLFNIQHQKIILMQKKNKTKKTSLSIQRINPLQRGIFYQRNTLYDLCGETWGMMRHHTHHPHKHPIPVSKTFKYSLLRIPTHKLTSDHRTKRPSHLQKSLKKNSVKGKFLENRLKKGDFGYYATINAQTWSPLPMK